MLTSTVVRLRARRQARLPRAMGQYGHAAFLSLVREVAPNLAAALHDAGGRKPFTVSPLSGVRRRQRDVRVQCGSAYWMRFTILDSSLYSVFSRYFADSRSFEAPLTLGGVPFSIDEVTTSPDSDTWAGYTTFGKLESLASSDPVVSLQFWSLTAFSLGHGDGAGPTYGILPDPALVFDSLLRRWNQFADQPLADPAEWGAWAARHVVVRAYRTRSDVWQIRGHPQVGFVGECTYEIKGDWPTQTRQLNMLADFAFYAGVGLKTTQGMGQCRRLGGRAAAS